MCNKGVHLLVIRISVFAEKITKHILRSTNFFFKSYLIGDNAEKCDAAREDTMCKYNMAHALFVLDN